MVGLEAKRSEMTVQVLFVQGGGANVHDGWDRPLVEVARDLRSLAAGAAR